MRFLALYLLLAGSVSGAFAQRNYVPGVIITHQNDSIRGLIDYRNWAKTPGGIRFKQFPEDTIRYYRPEEINGFRVINAGELYISRRIKMDVTLHDLQHLLKTSERVIRDTTLFLLTIVKGEYSLYSCTDMHGRQHYAYTVADSMPLELQYEKRVIGNENSSRLIEVRYYQGQLARLFADNDAIVNRVRRLGYNEKELRNVFIAYNAYKHPEEQPIVKPKEKSGVQFGLMAGLSFNNYNIVGAAMIAGGEYSSSVSPLLGVLVDIPFSRNRQQLSFSGELFYKALQTDGIPANKTNIKLGFSYLQLNVLLRYTYPRGKVRPFVNAGVGNALMLAVKHNDRSWPSGRQDEAIEGPRKHEQSIVAGVGARVFNRISAEVRYASGNGFSPYGGTKSTVNSLQLIAGYRF